MTYGQVKLLVFLFAFLVTQFGCSLYLPLMDEKHVIIDKECCISLHIDDLKIHPKSVEGFSNCEWALEYDLMRSLNESDASKIFTSIDLLNNEFSTATPYVYFSKKYYTKSCRPRLKYSEYQFKTKKWLYTSDIISDCKNNRWGRLVDRVGLKSATKRIPTNVGFDINDIQISKEWNRWCLEDTGTYLTGIGISGFNDTLHAVPLNNSIEMRTLSLGNASLSYGIPGIFLAYPKLRFIQISAIWLNDDTVNYPLRRVAIRKEIEEYKELQILSLNRFQLTWEAISGSKLKNIRVLILKDCGLHIIPSWVFELPNIEILDLSNNHLDYIPEDIKKLKKLKCLIVDQNELVELYERKIPNIVLKMPNLLWYGGFVPVDENHDLRVPCIN